MKISYDVNDDLIKPVRKEVLSEEMQAVIDFVDSEKNNMVFEYDTEDEARKRRNHIATHARRKNLPVRALLRENKVVILYDEKKDEEEIEEKGKKQKKK